MGLAVLGLQQAERSGAGARSRPGAASPPAPCCCWPCSSLVELRDRGPADRAADLRPPRLRRRQRRAVPASARASCRCSSSRRSTRRWCSATTRPRPGSTSSSSSSGFADGEPARRPHPRPPRRPPGGALPAPRWRPLGFVLWADQSARRRARIAVVLDRAHRRRASVSRSHRSRPTRSTARRAAATAR